MKPALSLNRTLIATLVPAAVFLTAILLSFSEIAQQHPEVYTGMTYDLILTTPILAFFLSKRRLPKWALSTLVLTGIVTAWLIIPKEQQQHLDYLRFIIVPLIEVIVLGKVVYTVYRTIQSLRGNPDHLTAITESAEKATGSTVAGNFFGAEFALFYYAFFTWKKQDIAESDFTSHRTSGVTAIYAGILMVLAAETICVHILSARWSESLAWILTIGSIYSMLLLFGWIKSTVRRPVSVNTDTLIIRNGLAPAFHIPLSTIERIEKSEATPEATGHTYRQALLGELEPHNIILHLKESVTCKMIYGKRKNCDTIFLHIDNKEAFFELVNRLVVRNETV